MMVKSRNEIRESNSDVVVEVMDDGPGIDKEILSRYFFQIYQIR